MAQEFRMTKPPVNLSLGATYSKFLKVAEVKVSQLDLEHMRWKHRRPASASPTNVSEGESYGITIQAIRSKKESPDRWMVAKMGKPLLSEAVSSISLFMHNET